MTSETATGCNWSHAPEIELSYLSGNLFWNDLTGESLRKAYDERRFSADWEALFDMAAIYLPDLSYSL